MYFLRGEGLAQLCSKAHQVGLENATDDDGFYDRIVFVV